MLNESYIAERIEQIKGLAEGDMKGIYATCLSCVDLTTLSPCDTEQSVRAFAERAVVLCQEHPEFGRVASLCVYPPFVECVGMVVDGSGLSITAVAGGFPSSQTFLEVKALEVAMAVESGADEIDIVIAVGEILEGRYDEAQSEVEMLRQEIGDESVTLKVILETGELKTPELIYAAAMVAMRGGADFIKTSTGKTALSATPEAAIVMCQAIKDFEVESGRKVGIKVAGGVRTAADCALYYRIVEAELGCDWLTPSLFRIGASAALDNLLAELV
ncbi:MAG: deoxyribose-phosphate aldolase [Rikenellaceae bacterium]